MVPRGIDSVPLDQRIMYKCKIHHVNSVPPIAPCMSRSVEPKEYSNVLRLDKIKTFGDDCGIITIDMEF